MEVRGLEALSWQEHTDEISEEQKCIKRRANRADGDGSEGTLEGSSAVTGTCEKRQLRVSRGRLT